MQRTKPSLFAVLFLLICGCQSSGEKKDHLKIWYESPASATIADNSFDTNDNPEAKKYLAQIRQLLFTVHPGDQINLYETPELAAAAKKSLDYRIAHGGGHTGWSAAWLISQYARLGEAEKAEESLNTVLKKSISCNLFGQHPPFQVDANFETTAGIAEMLLQSHAGIVHLLPALPTGWPDGKVSGLRARGGYTIDMTWKDGKLLEAKIRPDKAGEVKVQYRNTVKFFQLKTGEDLEFEP